MNYKAISKQGKFLLFSSVVGFISMFLPWVSFPIFGFTQSANGMHKQGIIVFICFILAGIIAVVADDEKHFFKAKWTFIQLDGIVALLCISWYFFQIKNSVGGIYFINVGFYISAIAALGVIVSAYLFNIHPKTNEDHL